MTIKDRLHQWILPSSSTEMLSPNPVMPLSSVSSSSSSWHSHRVSFSSTSSLTDLTTTNVNEIDYHIVLIDIKETVEKRRIECTKKLMDEPGLRYCAISYRWGEVSEQVAVTPDYVAHVTSFTLADLELLCGQLLISQENVDYLWVDAISIDQMNDRARKSVIRQMSNIYDHATMILAVPDLHSGYLKLSPANKSILTRIRKHTPQLYRHVTGACQFNHDRDFPYITSPSQSTNSLPDTPFTSITPTEHNHTQHPQQQQQQQHLSCECYRQTNGTSKSCIEAIEYLQYLVEDWSNRVWVISEYHIGRKKNMKLWFLSFDIQWYYNTRPQFVPLFDCIYRDHFRHRPFLDMMLHSQAKKNEDRFYSIIPLSSKYKDCIKTQDTVSQWNITGMTSVCMRLYTFVGLREKVAMLYNCSKGRTLILPSFASCYHHGNDPSSTLTKILDLQRDQLLIQSIVLMTPTMTTSQYQLYSHNDHPSQSHRERAYLQLFAKCHRILSTTNKETKMFWHQHAKICQQLEWNTSNMSNSSKTRVHHHRQLHHRHEKYHLDQVFIPFIESGIRTPIGVHLVGDKRVNRWIVYQLTIINVNVPATEWKLVDQVEEFHIY